MGWAFGYGFGSRHGSQTFVYEMPAMGKWLDGFITEKNACKYLRRIFEHDQHSHV
jgi:hypothetical protein